MKTSSGASLSSACERNSSLPSVEQKARQRFGICICRQFFLRDRLPEDRRDRVLPVRKRIGDLLSQLRILCRDLQTEATHQASANRSFLTVELHEVHEVPLETPEWRHLRSNQDRGGVLRLARRILLKRSRGKIFLAVKMVIEGA